MLLTSAFVKSKPRLTMDFFDIFNRRRLKIPAKALIDMTNGVHTLTEAFQLLSITFC